MPPGARRGPYAKGLARRAEILQAALAAYGAADNQQPSLKQIADSLGMTEAGILHYFDSKDHMLVAVLEARDEVARKSFDLTTWDGIFAAIQRTYETPGEVKLFVDMSVAAADPNHPAHAFLARRDAALRDLLRIVLGQGDDEDDWLPRILVAAVDGLQLRWLRDPDIDVVADMEQLAAALAPDRTARSAQ
ncbi:MAG: transcriptional regulator [Nocardia sp.]|uniref:TetR/AcrR family transcriptional regulator n=1 Tax=Nocardia sp. TaxID=1821 RepID=UPI0026275448|nr:TetR family transcriptional regulator [Nocardia sp.]MCU1641982.1 transcriptional regulator [Nocardia sp.]